MIKKLPFLIDNPVMTECWTHDYLGILMRDGAINSFIMEAFLSFYYDGSRVFLGSMDNPTNAPQFASDVIYDESLFSETDVLTNMIEAISRDKYVLVFCDRVERHEHMIHEIMLVGLDTQRKIFYHARHGCPEIQEIGYDELLKGFNDFIEYTKTNKDRLITSYNYKGPVRSLTVRDDSIRRHPRIDVIKERLYRHLLGCKTIDAFHEEQARSKIYGVPVYDALSDAWSDGQTVSDFWLVNNHKKILESRRLLAMTIHGLSAYPRLGVTEGMRAQAQELCDELDTVHNLTIRYTMTRDGGIIPKITAKLGECKIKDEALSSELYFCMLSGMEQIRWY